MIVDRTGLDTVLAEIVRLLDEAQMEKPAITRLADRAAAWFVSAVILIAAGVGWYWWRVEPDAWLPVLISVLVVTCPCALSLATPTAISAATGAMLANGLLTVRSHGLETLARSTHVVFDKTGTLTHGTPEVTRHPGACRIGTGTPCWTSQRHWRRTRNILPARPWSGRHPATMHTVRPGLPTSPARA